MGDFIHNTLEYCDVNVIGKGVFDLGEFGLNLSCLLIIYALTKVSIIHDDLSDIFGKGQRGLCVCFYISKVAIEE
jgi:hypothetical protein